MPLNPNRYTLSKPVFNDKGQLVSVVIDDSKTGERWESNSMTTEEYNLNMLLAKIPAPHSKREKLMEDLCVAIEDFGQHKYNKGFDNGNSEPYN